MFNRWIKLVCVIMAVVFPASCVLADARSAIMYTSGNAMLNGVGVMRSSALFEGDTIQTGDSSAATINADGSSVLLPAKSTVQFKGDAVEVQKGGAVITTSKGLKAVVDTVTVAPAKGLAKFEVTRQEGKVVIASNHGALAITSANGTTYLDSGASATFDSSDKSAKKKGGGAVPPVGGATGAGVSNGVAIAAGVAAAAAAAAIVWATTNDHPGPVSPRNP